MEIREGNHSPRRSLARLRALAGSVLLIAAAVAAAPASADDEAMPPAFLEVAAEPAEPFVGQRTVLRFRVGYDRVAFRERAVPFSLRDLDLPVRIEAPWRRNLPGREGPVPAGDGPAVTLALDDEVVGAHPAEDEVRDGRRYAVVEVRREVLPEAAGEVPLPAAALRFAFAGRFEEDALGRPLSRERREWVVESRPSALRVRPLPVEGRPAGFTGAVGRFTVEASCPVRETAVGEPVPLVLRIRGEGDLRSFDPPRLDGLEGFHELGRLDDRGAEVRTIEYEIVPVRPGLDGIPPVPFPHFDPGPPAGWRVARSEALPLRVRGGAGAPAGDGGAAPPPPGPRRHGEDGGPWIWVAAAAALLGAGILLARRRRVRSAGEAVDPAVVRLREAAAAFRERAGSDLAGAFAAFLAARLGCPETAVVSPDLAARLESVGVPAATAARAATLLDRLVGARYGGRPSVPADEAEARALVEALVPPATGVAARG